MLLAFVPAKLVECLGRRCRSERNILGLTLV